MKDLTNEEVDINNFRLLALYTDIRVFDTEIRKGKNRNYVIGQDETLVDSSGSSSDEDEAVGSIQCSPTKYKERN